jgi:2-polyprenyl-6-methoxyphenol hydroxylase-like FAD-dependent oxidoreductase
MRAPPISRPSPCRSAFGANIHHVMNNMDKDVIIVGAGPVGLFLARDLVRHGLRVLLVEKNAAQSEHSKALALMPRTLEVFEMAGIAAPFVAAQHVVTKAAVLDGNQRLGVLPIDPVLSRYPYVAMIPQDVTEGLLLAELRRSGGEVSYGTEALAVEQTEDAVKVQLRSGGEDRWLSAAHVVGTDGAHSAVRHALGLDFGGGSYAASFVLADIETTGDVPADEMQLCPHAAGALACFPMSASRRRIVAMVDAEPAGGPDLAFVQRLLDTRGLEALRATRLIWGSNFKIHHRQASSMRLGRVFLAGDAAHIHSPFGAQGMNTGLQDAWNLSWKLRLALAGAATPALLDSYSVERHAVAERVIRLTDTITKGMATRNPVAQAVRKRAIPILTGLDWFKRLFVNTLTELSVGYPHSPLLLDKGKGKGQRAADEELSDGARLYECLGRGFVLLAPKLAPALEAVLARYAGTVTHRVHLNRDGMRLIRPDGYVAVESETTSASDARLLEQVLAKQVLPSAPPVA